MASASFTWPDSKWLTYRSAGERLGLTQGQVAVRAQRRGWPTRKRSDTGEIEVEVPGTLLEPGALKGNVDDDQLLERVSRAVLLVERAEAKRMREKVYAEERAIAKARPAAPKRRWWAR